MTRGLKIPSPQEKMELKLTKSCKLIFHIMRHWKYDVKRRD